MAKRDQGETAVVRFMKGRGAGSNQNSRFDAWEREPFQEDAECGFSELDCIDDRAQPPRTIVFEQLARSIISRNDSPDIGFEQSLNPYMGCEHGCIYCYARPTHAYLGLSPGVDFETKIYAKTNAARLLREELGRRSYKPQMIALGANTDPYQPVERRLEISRSLLQVLDECSLPVAITTKSALVTRDIDILSSMAGRGLARVYISICTLDPSLAQKLEPRANSPARRIEAIHKLSDAGVPTGVFTSPVIPALNDGDMEKILERAAEAGAQFASYVMLRLPLEVRDLFVQWLQEHFPLRARHVMSLVNQIGEGKDYNSQFGTRMRGTGPYAELLRQRFKRATLRFKLNVDRLPMDVSRFVRPLDRDSSQSDLF